MDEPLDYRLVLDSFSDAVIASDGSGQIVYLNVAAEALLGWRRDELLGEPLTVIMPQRLRAAHEVGFRRFIETRQPRIIGKPIRVAALHRSGQELDIELTLSAFQVASGDLIVASLRDLRERIELEQQIAAQRRIVAQYQVMRVLMEAATVEEALPGILRVIAEALHWDLGVYWSFDRAQGVLDAVAIWGSSTLQAEAFVRETRRLRLAPGQGLPGRAWAVGEPIWSRDVGDDPRYVRAPVAVEQNLKSALLFPVVGARETFGVLEFLSKHVEQLDDELVQTMATIGFQIGQYLERLQQADRLRASEEWLATTLSSIGDAVIATDEHGNIVFLNDIAQGLTGWTSAEATGRPLDEVFHILHEITREPIESPVAKVLRERRIVSLANHTVLIARGGAESIIEDSGAPILTRDGRFRGVVLCFRDTTEKILARRKIQQAERRAALVAESVPNIVWTSGPDGRSEFFNQRWYDYTGLPPGSLDPEAWRRLVHPDDHARLDARWSRSLATGEPYDAEVRLLRASDQSYRWHLVRAVPLGDEEGQILQWVGSSTDIDTHKRAEESTRFLAEASATLATSLDYEETLKRVAALAVPHLADWCAIHLTAPDTLARQLVVTHRDPEKTRWAEQLNREYPPDPAALHGPAHVIRTGQPEVYPDIPAALLEATARDAEHLRILREVGMRSAMTLPLVARNRIMGAITLVTAESGRRYDEADLAVAQELATRAAHAVDNARLYNDAQEAIRVRDEFLSLASHELKTPLTPLQLHIQAMQRSARGEGRELSAGRLTEKLDTLERQVVRLETLVDSMLDISRITGNRLHIDCEDLELGALVREVAERHANQLEQAGSELRIDAPDALTGCWDRLRLDQIVSNLLGNAIKFGAGQPIDIVIRPASGGRVELVVKDYGIGIAPQDQDRIFERFERAVSMRHFGGFGLGLWITRQVIEALRGTIQVESELDEGSVFTVNLPLNSREDERGEALHQDQAP